MILQETRPIDRYIDRQAELLSEVFAHDAVIEMERDNIPFTDENFHRYYIKEWYDFYIGN